MEGKVERPMRPELTYPCKKKKNVTKLKLTKKEKKILSIGYHHTDYESIR